MRTASGVDDEKKLLHIRMTNLHWPDDTDKCTNHYVQFMQPSNPFQVMTYEIFLFLRIFK
jgi:hypothetical protein